MTLPARYPELEGILDRLRTRARRYFPDGGENIEVRLKSKTSRAYSEIYHVTVSDGAMRRRELIVKVFPNAKEQFYAMKALWPRFADHSTWRIPEPLDFLEEGPALVTEFIPVRSLQDRLPVLNWRASDVTQLQRDYHRAAQWLRFYHDLGRKELGILDIRDKLKGFAQSVLKMVDAGFDGTLCHKLAYHLCLIAERLVRQPRPFSDLHGDFTPANVLVDGSRVTVLDICGGIHSAVDHDIASFLNSLLLLRFTRRVPWAGLQSLRESFLHGYFGEMPREEDAIIFLQGIGLIDVVLEILSRRHFFLPRWWLQRCTAMTIKMIVRHCEKKLEL